MTPASVPVAEACGLSVGTRLGVSGRYQIAVGRQSYERGGEERALEAVYSGSFDRHAASSLHLDTRVWL
jgi:hypothetical protein